MLHHFVYDGEHNSAMKHSIYLAKVKIDDGNSYYTAVVASLPGNT